MQLSLLHAEGLRGNLLLKPRHAAGDGGGGEQCTVRVRVHAFWGKKHEDTFIKIPAAPASTPCGVWERKLGDKDRRTTHGGARLTAELT